MCLGRLCASGVGVESHSFAAYLSDLQVKMRNDGSGTSNCPANVDV